MRTFRASVVCGLLLVGASAFSGCATGQRDASEKAPPEKTCDNKAMPHKIGYYLLKPLEWILVWGSCLIPPD